MALPGMTPETLPTRSWIGSTATTSRARTARRSSIYSALGYSCKNGPLDTIEELLLVKGVTPDLLFGRDSTATA